MVYLRELAGFLDRFFAVERYDGDQGGVYRLSDRPVRRLGLALEPGPYLPTLAKRYQLDAVFLHRPWKLEPWHLPADVGVLAYHLAFDERLTLGYNPRLAHVLGLTDIAVFGEKSGRPLGMIGAVPPTGFAAIERVARQCWGGLEEARSCNGVVERLVVVGAMTDVLVREAAERGVQVYITGQLRQPARSAVIETGIGVLVVGHQRSEEWGLRALGDVLHEQWPALQVVPLMPNSG